MRGRLILFAALTCCARRETRPASEHADARPAVVFGASDLGLCTARPDKADLSRGEEALARGCAREALMIAEAGLRAQTPSERAQAGLLAAEARRLATNEGLGLHGGPGLAFLYSGFDSLVWTGVLEPPELPTLGGSPERSGLRMAAALHQDIATVVAAIGRGELPPTVVGSGRLAQLAVTAVPAHGCLDSRVPDDVGPTYFGELRRAREEAMNGAGALQPRTGGEWAARARAAVADCDLTSAFEAFRRAAELLHSEGARVAAVHSALAAIETASFIGGRADAFASGEATPEALVDLASQQEAGWAGFGAFDEMATEVRTMVDQTLARFPEEARDPGVRAQAQALLAVAAIRLRGRADDARQHAEQAIRDATAARRADLADLARVALVLAYAHEDLPDRAAAIGDALDRSFTARGTEGARVHVSRVLRNVAAIEAERGNSSEAIVLLQLGRRLYPRLSSVQERAMILRTLPMVLRDSGRVEEAIEAFEWARAQWAREARAVEPSFWAAMDRQLADELGGLQGQIGIEVSDADLLRELGLGTLLDALARNDAEGVRAALRAASDDQRLGMLSATANLGLCRALSTEVGAVVDQLEVATATMAEALRATVGSDDLAARSQMRMSMLEVGTVLLPQLAFGCGPWIGSKQVDRIVRMAELTHSVSGQGPLAGADRSLYQAIAAHARSDLDSSLQGYLRAARQLTERAGLSGATALGLGDLLGPLHGRAAQVALRLGRVEQALEILEQARSMDLRASRERARRGAGSPLGQLGGVEGEIARTQARARSIAQLLASASDPKTRAGLEAAAADQAASIARLHAERDRAVRRAKEKHGAAYRAAALAPPLRLAELQRALGSDETLVYYVSQPEEAWAIVVDRGGAHAVELPAVDAKSKMPRLANALARTYEELRTRAGRGLAFKADEPSTPPPTMTIERAREELHRALVEPVIEMIPVGRRVIVVPDPALSEVPFAALGTADAPWIGRNPLRVLPGAYLLAGAADARRAGDDAVVLGDPEFVAGAGRAATRTAAGEVAWQRLPFTRDEAQKVAALYRARPLLGADATEAAVRELSSRARILHIASHGLANTRRPDYSAIVLATPRDPDEDGILHAYEVERLELSAELVVLSACETGLGQVRGAEGMMALDRAFLVAGAGAVVSSLWTVDDASTELLLRSFHEFFRDGEAADVALARAMRRVREIPKWRDPYYWSAFRVVGTGGRTATARAAGRRKR